MREFAPGEAKTAVAPITMSPAGLSCQAELFLGPNDITKVATSGKVAFTSTGVSQDIRLPIAMPAEGGPYHVYIDVYTEDLLVLAYQVIEDVVIKVAEPPPPPYETIKLIDLSMPASAPYGPFTGSLTYEVIAGEKKIEFAWLRLAYRFGNLGYRSIPHELGIHTVPVDYVMKNDYLLVTDGDERSETFGKKILKIYIAGESGWIDDDGWEISKYFFYHSVKIWLEE